MRVKNGQLHFSPMLPKNWSGFEFKILFRGNTLNIAVDKQHATISHLQGEELTLQLFGKAHTLSANGELKVALGATATN
jgi:maltose phosphorylase